MKIGFFTDSHYSSREGRKDSADKIKNAYKYFEEEKCDLVVFLGDLIDNDSTHEIEKENLKVVAKIINGSPLKTVCLMGNHDGFCIEQDVFYSILQNCTPETMKFDGKTLIFMDSCYTDDGVHYSPDVKDDWTNTRFPNVDALEKEIENAKGEVYLFTHQVLDTNAQEQHIIHNADEINEMIAKSGKVKTVFQGHYHPGLKSVHNGINYVTFPAMFENEKAYFVEEI